MDTPDSIKVLTRDQTVAALGLSYRTFDRLEALGDLPAKTQLSEGRIGYRVCDIAAWLDRRRRESNRGAA
jgi:predicted DNA-binding transcriptional regulator AlpA